MVNYLSALTSSSQNELADEISARKNINEANPAVLNHVVNESDAKLSLYSRTRGLIPSSAIEYPPGLMHSDRPHGVDSVGHIDELVLFPAAGMFRLIR